MLKDWPELIGTAYTSESRYAAVERCENWYLEVIESPEEKKTRKVLYPRPGSELFGSALVTGITRGMLAFNGFAYGVNGTQFYSIDPDGTQILRGIVADDGKPVTMCANSPATYSGNGQIAIASAGELYVYSGGVFTHVPVSSDFFGAASVTFLDGYFIALTPNSSQFQISTLNDGLTWSAADIAILEGQADGIKNLIADKEYLYLIGGGGGGGRTELWYNTGNALFPFAIEQGAFMEIGIGPVHSLCQGDPDGPTNAVYWIGQSARGGVSAWAVVGLNPRRISTFAVEKAWADYSTIDDAVCYCFRWRGHMFVRYIFPTAGAGWQYDATASAQMGHAAWSVYNFTGADGVQVAPLERAHCYQYGRHLIGSGGAEGTPGATYALYQTEPGDDYYDAKGAAHPLGLDGYLILRRRTSPHLYNGNKRDIYNLLDLGMAVGVGLDVAEDAPGYDPQVLVYMSADGGNTYGNERSASMGKGGEYRTLIRFRRWGQARDCVFDIQVSDPVFAALINAEIDVTPGSS